MISDKCRSYEITFICKSLILIRHEIDYGISEYVIDISTPKQLNTRTYKRTMKCSCNRQMSDIHTLEMNVPESNVAVADVVAVSSVEADDPLKQLRVTISATLMVRSNIFTDKRG